MKKTFPFAAAYKKAYQQWNFLKRLTAKQKQFYKRKSRFFSLELGKPISKRVVWQMATHNPFLKVGPQFSLRQKSFLFSQKKESVTQEWNSANLPGVLGTPALFQRNAKSALMFQRNWNILRILLFKKMWVLDNPSLVPGNIWLTKTKKKLVVKMRAFKALSHLAGNMSVDSLTKNLQKLWNLSSQTVPSLWSLAGGLDSSASSTLLKSGFVCTLPAAFHSISRGTYQRNGCTMKKGGGFTYMGDFVSMFAHQTLPNLGIPKNSETALEFGKMFTYGPQQDTQKKTTRLYSLSLFLWLSSFFRSGKEINFYGKQTFLPKKRPWAKKPFQKHYKRPFPQPLKEGGSVFRFNQNQNALGKEVSFLGKKKKSRFLRGFF